MKGFLFCAVVVVLLNTCSLTADTIYLTNGDRLSGEVQSLASATFTFHTAYAGTIELSWEQIQALSTASPLFVEFDDGVSAVGMISSPQPGTLQIESDPPVSLAKVVAIYRETPVPVEPSFWKSWDGSANLGYTLVRGNTSIDNLTLNFDPIRETDMDRIRVLAQTLYNVQDDAEASSMHSVQSRYDRFLGSRLFYFVHGLVETDERETLDLRTSEGGGFGMEFALDPATQLSILGGMTFLQENFEGLNKTLNAEALAGLELETERFEPFVISTISQLLPILGESRYRIRWSANIRIPLFAGFSMGFQMFDNFDSAPPKIEIKRNDFGVVSTLGYTF
jgi:hypothetical protein